MSFKEQNETMSLYLFMNIFLVAFSSSSPTPMVEWIKIGEELPDKAVLKNFGKHLTIEEVKEDDEGKYMCKALNAHGEAVHYFHVAVEGEIFFFFILWAVLETM